MYSVIKRGTVFNPTVSGNGRVIAWRDLPEPGVSEIAIQREGEAAELFTDDNMADKMPSLNHDGSVVVWERYKGERNGYWDVVRQAADQSEPETIVKGGWMDTDADVSADGNTVVADQWMKDGTRTVQIWRKGEGQSQMSPEGVPSGLPEISGDGDRVFYLHLPPTPRIPNEIWMREADGSEKPVVYETDPNPGAIHKKSFDTNEDGSVLAWIQKEGVAPAEVWKWDLDSGVKQKIDEAPMAGGLDLSGDGSTVAWTTQELNEDGQRISLLHRKKDGEEERTLSPERTGHNTSVSLSDDGNTLVWMWKNPKYLHPHEIRKAEFE
jgi:Tol biopolymer transport system component